MRPALAHANEGENPQGLLLRVKRNGQAYHDRPMLKKAAGELAA
jgi:hypothetical protein